MRLGIDAARFIKEKGGVSETARYLTERGFHVTRQGVSKWKGEQMIPMRSWLRICEIEKGQINLNDYIVETK